jgi:serine/threonine-protein kinase
MLAGTPPFFGRTPQALLAAQLSEKPPALSARRYDVPKPLSDLIAQCLEKEPKKRPESAMSVLRTLEDPATISGVFDAPSSVTSSSRHLLIGGVLLAGLAVISAGVWRSRSRGSDPATPAAAVVESRALAVLPFDAIGNDSRVAEVAAGITSELTTAVAQIPGLRVSSLASAAAMRDRLRAANDSGPRPDVVLLLEGSVQRERNDFRVSVRLVRAANDSTMWAATYSGVADSTFKLQGSVVRSAAAALSDHLNPPPR